MLSPLDLERIYDTHAQALFSFLLSFLRNDAEARDLAKELFDKAAKRPDLLKGVSDERAFLLRLAHNQAIDLIRRTSSREKRIEELAGDVPLLFVPTAD